MFGLHGFGLFSTGFPSQHFSTPTTSNGPSGEALLAAWLSVIVVSVLFAVGMTGPSFQKDEAVAPQKMD